MATWSLWWTFIVFQSLVIHSPLFQNFILWPVLRKMEIQEPCPSLYQGSDARSKLRNQIISPMALILVWNDACVKNEIGVYSSSALLPLCSPKKWLLSFQRQVLYSYLWFCEPPHMFPIYWFVLVRVGFSHLQKQILSDINTNNNLWHMVGACSVCWYYNFHNWNPSQKHFDQTFSGLVRRNQTLRT